MFLLLAASTAACAASNPGDPSLPRGPASPPAPVSQLESPPPKAADPEPAAPSASVAPPSAPVAPPAPSFGPPPKPPQSVELTVSRTVHPGHSQTLRSGRSTFAVDEDGMLRDDSTSGDTLATLESTSRCAGRLDPAIHGELVAAARAALKSCVARKPSTTPDSGSFVLAVTVGGARTACEPATGTPAYARFQALQVKALAAVCPSP